MAQRFAALERQMSRAVDQSFGETVTILPKASGEFAAVADPEHSAHKARAIVDFSGDIA